MDFNSPGYFAFVTVLTSLLSIEMAFDGFKMGAVAMAIIAGLSAAGLVFFLKEWRGQNCATKSNEEGA